MDLLVIGRGDSISFEQLRGEVMVAKTACLQGRARAQPIISQGVAVPVTDLRHAEVAIHDSHSPENESKDGFKSKKEKSDLE